MEANAFFLQYHGKGYSKQDVDGMTLEVLVRHANRLQGQLKAEKDHHDQQMAKVKSRQ